MNPDILSDRGTTMDGGARRVAGYSSAYEAPRLTNLGTVPDMTRGIIPITIDGPGPGSTL